MVDKVPPEMLEYLFLRIDNPFDLFNSRAVCKKWHALITNERFLNTYFHNCSEVHSKRLLQWVVYRVKRLPLPDYNTRYPVPRHLQGSGSVVLDNRNYPICRTIFPTPTLFLNNHNYSISMWLLLIPEFERVTFDMVFDGFSLQSTLGRSSFEVFCSRTGVFEAQAFTTTVPLQRWFHLVLTYSSEFRLYINGLVYSLICSGRALHRCLMFEEMFSAENNGYLVLYYDGAPKFPSIARFADVQVLPYALTSYEIRAIVEKQICIEQLNMGRYLLDGWASVDWSEKYSCNCNLS